MQTFQLTDNEHAQATTWIHEHKNSCPCTGSKIDECRTSPISYIFTPSGIGTRIRLKCLCGDEMTIDSNW